MPDIRQTPEIDNFVRAGGVDENPIQPPWFRSGSGLSTDQVVDMLLETNGIDGSIGSVSNDPNDQGACYYEPIKMFGRQEMWAVSFANANLHDGYEWGILSEGAAPFGYFVHCGNSVGDPDAWNLWRYDYGTRTLLDQSPTGLPGGYQIVMIRLTNSAVECWFNADGTGLNWTLEMIVGDVTYRNGLHIHLGARGGAPGWYGVGGGIIRRTQIYRYVSN